MLSCLTGHRNCCSEANTLLLQCLNMMCADSMAFKQQLIILHWLQSVLDLSAGFQALDHVLTDCCDQGAGTVQHRDDACLPDTGSPRLQGTLQGAPPGA